MVISNLILLILVVVLFVILYHRINLFNRRNFKIYNDVTKTITKELGEQLKQMSTRLDKSTQVMAKANNELTKSFKELYFEVSNIRQEQINLNKKLDSVILKLKELVNLKVPLKR